VPLEVGFFQDLDEKGFLKRNFDRPPIKDTMTMPTGGYAVIRFIADNPGFWLLHCHLESHSDSGMIVMLKVGESKDLPPKPDDFGECF
jgi:L-ascorbate oxidase